MTFDDATVQSSARSNLISAAAMPGPPGKVPPPASPAYQAIYAGALEAELLTQLKHSDARVRMNAAVTLAKVAAVMNQGATFANVTKTAMKDSTEAVSMWGVRAAKEVYPNLLGVNAAEANATAALIVQAVAARPASPAIAQDAFTALAGSAVTGNAQRAGAGLDAMISLLQARAQAYAKVDPAAPADLPAKPELDAPVMSYLAVTGSRAMKPDQKARCGRAMFDQTMQIVRIGPLLPPNPPGAEGVGQQDMMKELRNVCNALQVFCREAPEAAAAAANLGKMINNPAQPLMEAEVKKIETAMAAAKILAPAPAATPAVVPGGNTPAALNK